MPGELMGGVAGQLELWEHERIRKAALLRDDVEDDVAQSLGLLQVFPGWSWASPGDGHGDRVR